MRAGCWAALILSGQALLPLSASAQTCPGHRETFANTRIVGGTQAKLAYWPALAALRLKDPAGSRAFYFCGGTAISAGWILTAAHCTAGITRSQNGAYVDTGSLKGWQVEVVLGTDDLESVANTHVHRVDDIVIREGYASPSVSGNDVALFHLATPWTGSVARLALSAAEDPTDSMSFAAGFGALKSGQEPSWKKLRTGDTISVASTKLQEVMLPIVKTETCKAAYQVKPGYKNAKIGPEQICAGYDRGRKDTCQGDSGGPLVFYDRSNCPSQIGVVSWGDGCAEAKAYGIYARVSAHREWILKHVPEANDAPVVVASRRAVIGIVDQQLATAVQQLETELASAKGRVRVGVSGGNQVKVGGLFFFKVESDIAGRLILLDVNADGELVQIFPNKYLTSGGAKFVERATPLLIPDASNPAYRGLDGFRAVEPLGRGRLIAIVAPKDVAAVEIVAAPERMNKGFAPEGAPISYVLNLFDQLIAAVATRKDQGDWALGETTYEIVK